LKIYRFNNNPDTFVKNIIVDIPGYVSHSHLITFSADTGITRLQSGEKGGSTYSGTSYQFYLN